MTKEEAEQKLASIPKRSVTVTELMNLMLATKPDEDDLADEMSDVKRSDGLWLAKGAK